MLVYILRRLPQTILVILGVTLITFIALQIGGDPTYLFVSERASPEEIIATRIKLGFDKPLYVQYLTYLKNLLLFDFGDSLYFRQPAMKVIFETLPATIELTIFSMLIAVFGSIPFGVYAAINRGKWLDGTLMAIAMLGQSVPNFWLGIMCILYISLKLQIKYLQITLISKAPTPSISPMTLSPGKISPTPAGVPVNSRSPATSSK